MTLESGQPRQSIKREDGDPIPIRGYEQLPHVLHVSNITVLCCILKMYFL